MELLFLEQPSWNDLFGTVWNSLVGYHPIANFDTYDEAEIAEWLDSIDIATVPEGAGPVSRRLAGIAHHIDTGHAMALVSAAASSCAECDFSV